MKRLTTVALVGRPNVGKSRLFNRLAGRRLAIVHDQAGVTRDVNSTVVNDHYTLLDTGGIGLVVDMDHDKLIAAAEAQVWFAVEAADLICFVLDGREGLTSLDETIAERLRQSGKQVLAVVNKIDHEGMESRSVEFEALGFNRVIPVSAEHGFNARSLEQEIEEIIGPPPEEKPQEEPHRIHLAFVGRPNVGKSTLVNTLMGEAVQETSAVREDDDRGRHTTTGRSLHRLGTGGWLIDTPGMRELQLVDAGEGIEDLFADIVGLESECRFSDCGHDSEPGCAVRAALEDGSLEPERWKRYRKLAAEEARNSETIAERRSRDKDFGKMVRTIMKGKNARWE